MRKFKLSSEKVRHVAQLAGLSLNSKEIKKFQKQLSEILDYVEILKKIDTKKIEPTSQVTGLENVSREDKATTCLSQKKSLANAPVKQNGFFKIKSITEKWN